MRLPEPSLSAQTIINAAIPTSLNLVLVFVLVGLLHQFQVQLEDEHHARAVENHLNEILRLLMQEGTLAVSTRVANTATEHANKRRELDTRIHEESDITKELVAGHPDEEAAYNEIFGMLHKCLEILSESKQQAALGDRFAVLKAWSQLNKITGVLNVRMDELIRHMNEVAEQTQAEQAQIREQLSIAIIVAVVLNIIMFTIPWYFYRGMAKRLNALMDNTVRLAAGKELTPRQEGTNEIAKLDSVFRKMAELLEEANRKQRAAFENAVDVICSIDTDGRFAAVNPASQIVWGLAPDDLLGTRISQMVFKDDVNDTLEKINKIVSERSSGAFENRVIKNDRSLVDMRWTAQWSNEEKVLFCVAHDITERKQIDRLKADFVAMVSHDLRTPLNSVQGFLELLGAEVYGHLTEDGYDSLEITEASVKRLIALINDLLDLEKMESGMLELRVEPAELKSILTASVGAVISFAKQSNVAVKIADNVGMKLQADSDRVIQVVVNLLSNAIKFSPKGSEILIDIDKQTEFVRINIRDQGRGVPEKMRESIFERFKQVELNDERKKGGSGLGLAICKAIVERHGGKIGVDPGADGVGSVFWFTLPVAAVPAASTSSK